MYKLQSHTGSLGLLKMLISNNTDPIHKLYIANPKAGKPHSITDKPHKAVRRQVLPLSFNVWELPSSSFRLHRARPRPAQPKVPRYVNRIRLYLFDSSNIN